MPAKIKHRPGRKIADSYLGLVVEFPLISIKSDEQLAAAQTMIDKLLTAGRLNEGEELYLDALSDLVAAYEDVHFPIAPASDADMLRHLLDNRGITHAELHRQTGIPRSTISEVLAGKKSFSKALIRTLAGFFKVDTSVLASNL
ncbi:MAG TPA: helix-turn-helix domain-containing protein [Gemmataceae bacterium]|nr:helix-turn-helix domain-containing protein [Gemmataceae bacterium]